jgi:hypothetical protein
VYRDAFASGFPGCLVNIVDVGGQSSDAAALAHDVLDAISADALRQTSRLRLCILEQDVGTASGEAPPPLIPVSRISDEPNGN